MKLKKNMCLFILGCVSLLYGGGDYNFFMISDTHFGTAKSFCTDQKAKREHRTRKDIHRADKAMPHYKALFAKIADTADSQTKFIIEGDDLIEGCTHNEATHKEVLADALAFMKNILNSPSTW